MSTRGTAVIKDTSTGREAYLLQRNSASPDGMAETLRSALEELRADGHEHLQPLLPEGLSISAVLDDQSEPLVGEKIYNSLSQKIRGLEIGKEYTLSIV